jgi:hypothetical protein
LTTPYSVLLDGNFIVMCFQQKVLPIRERVERVLQISSTTIVSTPSASTTTATTHHHHQQNRKMLHFCITQDTIDELQMILENLNRQISSHVSTPSSSQKDDNRNTKKQKLTTKAEKIAAFEEALQWIQQECYVLPKVSISNGSLPLDGGEDDQKNMDADATAPVLPAWTAIVHYIWGQQEADATVAASTSNGKTMNGRKGGRGTGPSSSPSSHSLTLKPPYIVASQDEEMLDILRRGDMSNMTLQEMITATTPKTSQQEYVASAVPILRLANNNSVLLLEQPSKQFQKASLSDERQKWSSRDRVLTEHERALVDLVKKQKKVDTTGTVVGNSSNEAGGNIAKGAGAFSIDMTQRRKVGKKAKGPNPLSCKRKQRDDGKRTQTGGTDSGESASKRRRDRAKRHKISSSSSS